MTRWMYRFIDNTSPCAFERWWPWLHNLIPNSAQVMVFVVLSSIFDFFFHGSLFLTSFHACIFISSLGIRRNGLFFVAVGPWFLLHGIWRPRWPRAPAPRKQACLCCSRSTKAHAWLMHLSPWPFAWTTSMSTMCLVLKWPAGRPGRTQFVWLCRLAPIGLFLSFWLKSRTFCSRLFSLPSICLQAFFRSPCFFVFFCLVFHLLDFQLNYYNICSDHFS